MASTPVMILGLLFVAFFGYCSHPKLKKAWGTLGLVLFFMAVALHIPPALMAPLRLLPVVLAELILMYYAGRYAARTESKPGQVGVVLAGLVAAVALHWLLGRDAGEIRQAPNALVTCGQNLTRIAEAQESYAKDSSGEYATEILNLKPKYLETVPTCPLDERAVYELKIEGETDFLVNCPTGMHQDVPEGYPRYNSASGLESGLPRDYDRFFWYRASL